MEVRDVRRMAVTAMLAGVAALLWLLGLWGQQRGATDWGPAATALEVFDVATWTWMVAALLTGLLVLLGLVVFGIDLLPPGWHQGSVRQVQCDHCRAVFLLNDTGHRPLTHQCPNCHYLGFYDGTRKPVGDAHKTVTRREVTRLALRCRHCREKFSVTDSGVRPMRVECPNCQTVGRLR